MRFPNIPKARTITVRNWWSMWYHTRFSGYRVVRNSMVPRKGLVGEIRYRRSWTLERQD
jgi:hypothetical protein